jgi:phosphatidylglycerophosphatase C
VRQVAAFDFDGTLSTRDNVLPFLRRVAGTTAFTRGLLGAAPLLARGKRDAAKVKLVSRALHARDADAVAGIGVAFADDVVRTHLRAEMVTALRDHRERGHEIVLISASLTTYLGPVGERLGVDAVLASEPEVVDGLLTGRLLGANVRGEEKVRRLHAWLGDDPCELWAYGDTGGDAALLARADHPVWVGRKARKSQRSPR